MASNEFNFKVKLNEEGNLTLTTERVGKLGAAVSKASRASSIAAKESAGFYNTQEKGVIGIANSTKSFSKLAETIQGSSGVVGAYATLAANAFALHAAFEQLKGAAQLDQVFRGLADAGARSGISLDVVGNKLRAITDNTIDLRDAYTATARTFAAGFSTKQIEGIGQAANDASYALGQNETETLNRIVSGVEKLRPQLLAQIGIFTTVNDSSARYAATLGKSVDSLSAVEKRQGYLNAVLAEAKLKFGGLSEGAGDSRAFNQFGATVTNLKNAVLGFLNTAIIPFISLIGSNPIALGGMALIFASTLKNQLAPGLLNAAASASKAAIAFKSDADAKLRDLQITRELAQAEQAQILASKANFQSIEKGPKVYSNLIDKIKDGTATVKEHGQALTSLQRSYAANEQILAHHKDFQPNADPTIVNPKREDKLKVNEGILNEVASIQALDEARKNSANFDVENSEKVLAAHREVEIAQHLSANKAATSDALQAASSFKVRDAVTAIKEAHVQYRAGLELTSGESLVAFNGIRAGAATAALSVRVLGAAFLNAIPIIGQLIFAGGLLIEAFQAFESEVSKKTNKALAEFGQIAGEVGNKVDAYNKIQHSTASASQRIIAATILQSNAVKELVESYNAYTQVQATTEASTNKYKDSVVSLGAAIFNNTERGEQSWFTGLKENSVAIDIFGNSIGGLGSHFLGTNKEMEAAAKEFGGLAELAPDLTKKFIAMNGGVENIAKQSDKVKKALTTDLGNQILAAIGPAGQAVQEVSDAFTNLDESLQAFGLSQATSTPFDAQVKNFNALTSALADLNKAQRDGANVDAGKVFSGIGANVLQFLKPATAELVTQYNKYDQIRQTLQEQLDVQKTLSAQDRGSLDFANQRLSVLKQRLPEIQKEEEVANSLFQNAQASTLLDKSRESILQARMTAVSSIYSMTGAGLRDEYAQQDKLRELQVHQLETAKHIVDVQLANQKAKIQEVKINSELSKQDAERLLKADQLLQSQYQLSLQKAGINSNTTPSAYNASIMNQRRGPTDAERGNYATLVAVGATASRIVDEKKVIDAREQVEAITRTLKPLEQEAESLSNQIKQVLESAPTAAERLSKIAALDVKNQGETLTKLQTQENSLKNIEAINRQINMVTASTSDELGNQLSVITEASRVSQREADTRNLLEISTARANLEVITATANRAGVSKADREAAVSLATDQYTIAKQQQDIDDQLITAQRDLAILEKVNFDTQKEGYQWQQESLKTLQDVLAVQKELNDAEQTRAETRGKLIARQSGREIGPTEQQAREIIAARKAYEFAIAESEIRKSLIDLQYALLEAQRDNLVYEMQTRQSYFKQDDDHYKQLQSIIDRASKVDFTKAADTAKRTIDIGIESKKNELSLLTNSTGTSGFFGKILSAAVGATLRTSAINIANQPIQKPEAQPVVLDKTKPGEEASNNPIVVSNNALKDSINALRERLMSWLKDNTVRETIQSHENEANSSTANTGRLSGNVKTAVEYLLREGFSKVQTANIVGNLQKESYGRIDPSAHNDIKGGHDGIAQWDAGRAAKFEEFIGRALKGSSLTDQLRFLVHEIRSSPDGFRNSTKRDAFLNGGIGTGTIAFRTGFERAGDKEAGDESRVNFARNIFDSISTELPTSAQKAGETFEHHVNAAAARLDRVASAAPAATTLTARQLRALPENSNRDLPSKTPIAAPANDNAASDSASIGPDNIALKFDTLPKDILKGAQTIKPGVEQLRDTLNILTVSSDATVESLKQLGPQGEAVGAVISGTTGMSNGMLNAVEIFQKSHENINKLQLSVAEGGFGMSASQARAVDFSNKVAAAAAVATQAISMVDAAMTASSKSKEAGIDREIAAEQLRDGHTIASQQKIRALELQKDAQARKSFEVHKKLSMAEAVVSTAAGVALALKSAAPPFNFILAGMTAALGLAQVAVIAGTSYQSTVSPVMPNTQLTIGKRGDTVDLARQNINPGGEVGYLRGTPGHGSNASNYSVIGSAYGGDLFRGYGNTGFVVGEKGPETIHRDTPITVRPANDTMDRTPVNATIHINAMDSRGVEDVLHDQRGNIISMLRSAANASGQTFLEEVNVNVLTRPNKASRL